jgi:hypothetical protein
MLWDKSVRWVLLRKILPSILRNGVDQGLTNPSPGDSILWRGCWYSFLLQRQRSTPLKSSTLFVSLQCLTVAASLRTDLQQLASLCDNSSTTRLSMFSRSSIIGSSAKTLSSKTFTSIDGTFKECNCHECCLSFSSTATYNSNSLLQMKRNV